MRAAAIVTSAYASWILARADNYMHVAEITRSETIERAQLLRVESYDIQPDLTAGEKLFRSQSVIVFDQLR